MGSAFSKNTNRLDYFSKIYRKYTFPMSLQGEFKRKSFLKFNLQLKKILNRLEKLKVSNFFDFNLQ